MKSFAVILWLAPLLAAAKFLLPAKIEPPCSNIRCGAYECPAPFTLKTDKTCCGYCWAPDARVSVDRHTVVAYNASGHAIDQCDSAPSHCKGPGPTQVRCFRTSCREGEEANCQPGACCPICQVR